MMLKRIKIVVAALISGTVGGVASGGLLGAAIASIFTITQFKNLSATLTAVTLFSWYGMISGSIIGIIAGVLGGLLLATLVSSTHLAILGKGMGSVIGGGVAIFLAMGWEATSAETLAITIAGAICGTIGGQIAAKIMLYIDTTRPVV